MINTNKIVASNVFSGFQNSKTVDFGVAYDGGTIPVGGYVGPIRATVALPNANSISQIQLQYIGLESFSRLVSGYTFQNYPSGATVTYQIQSYTYFSNGLLYQDNYISNQTGNVVAPATVTIPAITFQSRAFLFNAPF
jgi:hypothetical protein